MPPIVALYRTKMQIPEFIPSTLATLYYVKLKYTTSTIILSEGIVKIHVRSQVIIKFVVF